MSTVINFSEDACIICFEQSGKLLKNTCYCTNLLVHKNCLKRWILTKNSYKCEMCDKEYRIKFFRIPEQLGVYILSFISIIVVSIFIWMIYYSVNHR